MGNNIYRELQKHLNRMPVGFPSTLTGVELRILKKLYTPEEADIALKLGYQFKPLNDIYASVNNNISENVLKDILDKMDKKGIIFLKTTQGVEHYALVPYVIGIYEMQVQGLTADLYNDTRNYFINGYGLEFLSSTPSQTRIIPIQKSIKPEHGIATYDEIVDIINKSGDRICIAECICKKAKDLINEPCTRTKRREVCIGLRDYSDTYIRNGWGRYISKQEALALLSELEKDGLVLRVSNSRNPQFVCACCSCCCGLLCMISFMPRSVDFIASNYYAELNSDKCNGCSICIQRCSMNAIKLVKKKGIIDKRKCIGCGLCITTCKRESIMLRKKDEEIIPPETDDDLFNVIMQNKKSLFQKVVMGIKALLRMRV